MPPWGPGGPLLNIWWWWCARSRPSSEGDAGARWPTRRVDDAPCGGARAGATRVGTLPTCALRCRDWHEVRVDARTDR
eukprot:5364506-Prymnesium_polylepis.1